MKHILSTALMAFAAVCLPGTTMAQQFEIKGTAPAELNGQDLQILRHGNFYAGETNQQKTTVRVENGKWSWKGEIKGDSTFFISGGQHSVEFIVEPGTATIDMAEGKLLGGTPLNDALADWTEKKEAIQKAMMAEYSVIQMDSTIDDEAKAPMYTKITDSYADKFYNAAVPFLEKYKDYCLRELLIQDLLNSNSSFAFYDRLVPYIKYRPLTYGPLKGLTANREGLRETQPGCKFKDFTIKDGNLDGTPASLSDYVGRGKWVLVDFWASWCGWCRKEFPVIADVYQKHKGDNFEIVGLVVNDRLSATKKALEEEKLCVWPQIVNGKQDVMDLYGVWGIPQIILFAPDGTIAARDLRGTELKETVDAALAGTLKY